MPSPTPVLTRVPTCLDRSVLRCTDTPASETPWLVRTAAGAALTGGLVLVGSALASAHMTDAAPPTPPPAPTGISSTSVAGSTHVHGDCNCAGAPAATAPAAAAPTPAVPAEIAPARVVPAGEGSCSASGEAGAQSTPSVRPRSTTANAPLERVNPAPPVAEQQIPVTPRPAWEAQGEARSWAGEEQLRSAGPQAPAEAENPIETPSQGLPEGSPEPPAAQAPSASAVDVAEKPAEEITETPAEKSTPETTVAWPEGAAERSPEGSGATSAPNPAATTAPTPAATAAPTSMEKAPARSADTAAVKPADTAPTKQAEAPSVARKGTSSQGAEKSAPTEPAKSPAKTQAKAATKAAPAVPAMAAPKALATAAPAAPAKPAPTAPANASAKASSGHAKVIGVAKDLTGVPYVWGGTSTNGFDCSGYTQEVFSRVGVDLPRTAAQQQAAVKKVSKPKAGDLVFFGQPAHHVGIYAGDGHMYDAPRAGKTTGKHRIWSSGVTYGRAL